MALVSRPQSVRASHAQGACEARENWIAQMASLILIRWIVIYPVDSTIQRLNNPDLACKYNRLSSLFPAIHVSQDRLRNRIPPYIPPRAGRNSG